MEKLGEVTLLQKYIFLYSNNTYYMIYSLLSEL